MFDQIKTFNWEELDGKELVMMSSITEEGKMLVGIEKDKGLMYVLAYEMEEEK